MLNKLMYILSVLLMTANLAAQESYVIDEVCQGTMHVRIESKVRKILNGNGNWKLKMEQYFHSIIQLELTSLILMQMVM